MVDRAPVLPWSEMIDAAADAVVVVAADKRVLYANRAVSATLGWEHDELVGRSYEELVPERLLGRHDAHHGAFLAAPTTRMMGASPTLVARRRDGTEIPVEIALVPLHHERAVTAVLLRDVSARTRLVERLDATTALFRSALASAGADELEHVGIRLAVRLAHATSGWLGRRDGDRVVVTSGWGPDGDWLAGASLSWAAADAPTPTWPDSAVTAPLALLRTEDGREVGPADAYVLLAPVAGGEVSSVLASVRATPFEPADVDVVGRFAPSIATALELTTVRERLADLALVAEHDRIARDLHDSAIQRLISVGLRLESVLATPGAPAIERVGEAIDELDEVVREIRSAIFNLRRVGRIPDGVRAAVAEEVDRFARSSLTSPRLRFTGLVDAVSTTHLADEVSIVVREALSNVARHARATRVDVSVAVDDGDVVVTVADDGVGLPEGSRTGEGLANLAARADALGGRMQLSTWPAGGTTLEWRVPIGGSSAGDAA